MESTAIDKTKLSNLLLLHVFYLLLIASFHFVVRYEYAFMKAPLEYKFDLWRFFIGISVVSLGTIVLTVVQMKDFMYSITSMILIFFTFPSGVIFTYVHGIDWRIFFAHNLFFLMVVVAGKIKIAFRTKKLSILQSKKLLSVVVILGMIPFIILFAPHVNWQNLLLVDIYETRAELSSTVDNLYTNYTYSWFNKFIIPCLLVFGIYLRDRTVVIVGSVSLIFLFLCGAHKAVFIGLIITFLLYRYDYIKKINFLIKSLIGVGLIAFIVAIIFDNDFLMTMSLRRGLLLPAMVDVLYFDLFDQNHILWSETFNGLLKEYPYELEHSYVIGEKYFGDPAWGANNGIVSDGFMNAGMIGVVINVVLVSIYFSILNQLGIDRRFFGLYFLFFFLILSGSLTTVMLSHGGMILLILSFLFLKNTNSQMSSK